MEEIPFVVENLHYSATDETVLVESDSVEADLIGSTASDSAEADLIVLSASDSAEADLTGSTASDLA